MNSNDQNFFPRAAFGGFGHETSAAYMDEHEAHLNASIAMRVKTGEKIRVLDLACGMGKTSLRLAKSGAVVTAIDLNPETPAHIQSGLQTENLPQDRVRVITKDMRQLPEKIPGGPFDYILFQRALDCLPYIEGEKVMRKLSANLKSGGGIYLTVSSPSADYAKDYAGQNKPIKTRFDRLAPEFQMAHHFTQPICMYHPPELRKLAAKSGLRCEQLYLSAAGSNKLIATTQPQISARWIGIAAAAIVAFTALIPVWNNLRQSPGGAIATATPQSNPTKIFSHIFKVENGKEILVFTTAPDTDRDMIQDWFTSDLGKACRGSRLSGYQKTEQTVMQNGRPVPYVEYFRQAEAWSNDRQRG